MLGAGKPSLPRPICLADAHVVGGGLAAEVGGGEGVRLLAHDAHHAPLGRLTLLDEVSGPAAKAGAALKAWPDGPMGG